MCEIPTRVSAIASIADILEDIQPSCSRSLHFHVLGDRLASSSAQRVSFDRKAAAAAGNDACKRGCGR